jgi:hypothetical protein
MNVASAGAGTPAPAGTGIRTPGCMQSASKEKPMKKLLTFLALVSIVALSASAFAMDQKSNEPKAMTLKGEIVDMGCYLGMGAKGPDHKACALKCIQGGMPMGLLTSDGTLYLLTMSHADADPYNQAKTMAADIVEITGPVMERNGIKGLEVDKLASASMGKGK